VTNVRPLTAHVKPCYTHKMATDVSAVLGFVSVVSAFCPAQNAKTAHNIPDSLATRSIYQNFIKITPASRDCVSKNPYRGYAPGPHSGRPSSFVLSHWSQSTKICAALGPCSEGRPSTEIISLPTTFTVQVEINKQSRKNACVSALHRVDNKFTIFTGRKTRRRLRGMMKSR